MTKRTNFGVFLKSVLIVYLLFSSVQLFAVKTLSVGDVVTLQFPYSITSKTLAGMPSCVSSRPMDVQVISSDYSSVTVKAVRAFSGPPCLIQVKYYYRELYNGQIYQRSGSYDFRVFVQSSEPSSVSVYPTNIYFNGFDRCTIQASVSPSNAETTFTWRSTNPKVASVDGSGNEAFVMERGFGECQIIVTTSNGLTAACDVTVPGIKPTKVELPHMIEMREEGGAYPLTPTVYPKGATTTFRWSSDEPAIASVDYSGLVYAHKVGTTNIRVKTPEGLTAVTIVKVKEGLPKPTEVSLPASIVVYKGSSIQVRPKLKPENTETKFYWDSDRPDVARAYSNCWVYTYQTGTATLHLKTANGLEAQMDVIVQEWPSALRSKVLELGNEFDQLYTRTSKDAYPND